MSQVPTVVDPAWISTTNHLAAFKELVRSTPLYRKMLLGYRLPEGFPAIRVGLGWVPTVQIAMGVVTVDEAAIRFRSTPPPPFPRRRNMIWNLSFELHASRILSVEPTHSDAGPIKYYEPPFLRIRSLETDWLSDFLICAGGSGPSMKRIHERTGVLLESLKRMMAR